MLHRTAPADRGRVAGIGGGLMGRSAIFEVGWYGMACWNALSEAQRTRLVEWGNLPLGSHPEGDGCQRGAEVAVESHADVAPGPRFYCRFCAVEYLLEIPGLDLTMPEEAPIVVVARDGPGHGGEQDGN